MSSSKIINKLKKLTKKIEAVSSQKGSYQSEYEIIDCPSVSKFSDWIRKGFIPAIQSDFENYTLHEYSQTYIKLIGRSDEIYLTQSFILEEVNITSEDVIDEIVEAFSIAIVEMNILFKENMKNTFTLQLWTL